VRVFAARVSLESADRSDLRAVHGELARAMVDAGAAGVSNANGKVKAVRLVQSAAAQAHLLGRPTGTWGAVRFHRWGQLDCGTRVEEHHPRCRDYAD
jgi:hypothetical protein